jgi:toxin-antitoxin system PIN domain toxin
VIAVDTNVLVHAHRAESPWHEAALAVVKELAEGSATWAIAWPCIHEFLAIVTHPRIWAPPTPLSRALDQVAAWMESPSLVLLSEGDAYWPALREAVRDGRVTGGAVHDARVAALCRHHGVRELLSADRDFSRFRWLRTRNPLLPPAPAG